MADKDFDIGDILSITTSRLVSRRHMEGIYDILNHMTGDELFTHQLPRACEECRPWLLRWFPELVGISIDDLAGCLERHGSMHGCEIWLDRVLCNYPSVKRFYTVGQIPKDDHRNIHPLDELPPHLKVIVP